MPILVRVTHPADRKLTKLLGADGYKELRQHLAENPFAGDLMPRSGGARKLRWAVPGHGKRGALRVLHKRLGGEVWVFGVYTKTEWENPPDWLLKQWLKSIGN